jgi:hypothetical protein
MRCLLVMLLLLPSAPRARADGYAFAHFLAGGTLPLGNSDWTGSVDPSPKLEARVGGMSGSFGGMVSGDWTFEQLRSKNAILPTATKIAIGRLRVLGHIVFERRLSAKLLFDASAGAGVDLQYVDYTVAVAPNPMHRSETYQGYAFELAAAAWFDVGPNVQVGGLLALPISQHSTELREGATAGFNYTSVDLDVLFGVRVTSPRD